MDVLANLEKGVERLLAAHAGLVEQVRQLEKDNQALRAGKAGGAIEARVAELEAEREGLRERLETLVAKLAALETEG